MRKPVYKLFLVVAGLVLVYFPGFTARFFQDDWLILELAKSGNWLTPLAGNNFRPLAFQGFYGLGLWLFGRNPLGFHLLLFIFFCLTLYFIYKLSDLFTAFLYAFNVSLFAFFYWVATSYFVLAGLFVFSSTYFFTKNKGVIGFILFLAGLLTNELVVVEAGLLLLLRKFRQGVVIAITGFLFIIWRLRTFPTPNLPDYQWDLSLKFFSTLRWYLLRALNLPEGILNGPNYGILVLLGVLGLLVLLNWKNLRLGDCVFATAWFLIGAAPFYFLPNHMSAYYISIALFGPMALLSKVIKKYRVIFAGVYLLMTILGLQFLSLTHWVILKLTP
jgi:hypothetical protein